MSDITFREIHDPSSEDFSFARTLLTSAFPGDEYRDLGQWADFTAETEEFHNCVILDGDTPAGIIAYWDFPDYIYIEHLATLPSLRGRGTGARVMEHLAKQEGRPLVLEVELPEGEMERRRIGFYERCGLRLWETPYTQPSYRPGGKTLPMRLMASPELSETRFPEVEATLHRRIYGHTDIRH